MEIGSIFSRIRNTLSEADRIKLVSTLGVDGNIWSALQAPDFFDRVVLSCGPDVGEWTPDRIALIGESLRRQPGSISPDDARNVLSTIQDDYGQLDSNRFERRDHLLLDAYQTAVLIFRQYQQRRNWHFLPFLQTADNMSWSRFDLRVWKTRFSILTAFFDDPGICFADLIAAASSYYVVRAVVHGLMTQPQLYDTREQWARTLAQPLSPERQQYVWMELNRIGERSAIERPFRMTPESIRLQSNWMSDSTGSMGNIFHESLRVNDALLDGSAVEAESVLKSLQEKLQRASQQVDERIRYLKRFSPDTNYQNQQVDAVLTGEFRAAIDRYAGMMREAALNGDEDAEVAVYHSLMDAYQRSLGTILDGADRYLPGNEDTRLLLETLVHCGYSDEAERIAELMLFDDVPQLQVLDFLIDSERREQEHEVKTQFAEWRFYLAPKNPEHRRYLANIYQQQQKFDQAFEQYRSLLSESAVQERNDWIHFAECGLALGQEGVVIEACQRVTDENPRDSRAHSILGQAYASLGNCESAAYHYDRAIEYDEMEMDAWSGLADLHLRHGNELEAERILVRALEINPRAIKIGYQLADLFAAQQRNEEAIGLYERVVAQEPDHLIAALRLFDLLWQAEQFRRMDDLIRLHWTRWENHPDMCFWYGKLLLEQHRAGEAIPFLRKSINLNDFAVERIRVFGETVADGDGRLLFDDRVEPEFDWDDLKNVIFSGLGSSPNDFVLNLISAQILLHERMYGEALERFNTLLSFRESSLDRWKWQLQVGIGMASMALGNLNVTLAALQIARKIRPDDHRIAVLMAEASMAAGLRENSLKIAEVIRGKHLQNPEMMDWYIDFLIRSGEVDRANHELDQLSGTGRDQVNNRMKLAGIALRQGAIEALQKNLRATTQLDGLPNNILRKIAYYYDVIGVYESAIEALRMGAYSEEGIQITAVVELWKLFCEQGLYEEALALVDDASGEIKASILSQFMKVDSYLLLEQFVDAEKLLESLVQLPMEDPVWEKVPYPDEEETILSKVEAEEWAFFQEPASLFVRLALTKQALGKPDQAVDAIEKALLFDPRNPLAQYYAAYLILAGNMGDKTGKISSLLDRWAAAAEPEADYQKPYFQNLTAMHLEVVLDSNEPDRMARVKHQLESSSLDRVRKLALEARIAAFEGDLEQGERAGAVVSSELEKTESHHRLNQLGFVFDSILADRYWLADLYSAIEHWNTALELLYEEFSAREQKSYQTVIRLMKYCCRLYELNEFRKGLSIQVHLPFHQVDREQWRMIYDQASTAFDELSTETDRAQWDYRKHWLESSLSGKPITLDPTLAAPLKMEDYYALLQLTAHNDAVVNLHQVENVISDDAYGVMLLAVHFSQMGKGYVYVRQALARRPRNPVARYVYAKMAYQQGDLIGAYQSIAVALNQWNDESVWHTFAAELAAKLGENEAVITHRQAVLTLNPVDVDNQLQLVDAYLRQSSINLAVKYLNQLPDSLSDTQRNTQVALKISAAEQLGDYEQVQELVNQIRCIDRISVDAVLAASSLEMRSNHYDRAMEYVQQAYQVDATYGKTLLMLAKILFHEGHRKDASAILSQIGVDTSRDILIEKLRLEYEYASEKTYLQDLNQLLDVYPDEPEFLYMRALTEEKKSRWSEAERMIKSVLQLDRYDVRFHRLAGKLHQKCGHLDQAIQEYSEAIRLDRENVELYIQLANVYRQQRNPEKALDTFQRAIQIVPENEQLYYQTAMILKETNEFDDAQAMLMKAASLAPGNEEIRRQLSAVMALNLVHHR